MINRSLLQLHAVKTIFCLMIYGVIYHTEILHVGNACLVISYCHFIGFTYHLHSQSITAHWAILMWALRNLKKTYTSMVRYPTVQKFNWVIFVFTNLISDFKFTGNESLGYGSYVMSLSLHFYFDLFLEGVS